MNKSLLLLTILLSHFSIQGQKVLFDKFENKQTDQSFMGFGKEFPSWKLSENIYTVDHTDILKLCVVNIRNKRSHSLTTMPYHCRGAVSWTFDNSLFLFGGRESNGRQVTNSLWQYLVDKNQWIEITKKGVPDARSNPIIWSDDANVWMYGGEGINPENGEAFYYDDFWKFNKKEHIWEEIKTESGPSPRSRGIAWVYDKTLWLYGGFDSEGLSDMWIFRDEKWQDVSEKLKSREKSYSANEIVWPGEKYDAHAWVSPEGLWMWGGNMYRDDKDPFFWLWTPESQKWKAVISTSGSLNPDDYSFVNYEKTFLSFIKNPKKESSEIINATITSLKQP